MSESLALAPRNHRSVMIAAGVVGAALLCPLTSNAHEVGGAPDHDHAAPAARPLPVIVETKGPIRSPVRVSRAAGVRTTGQGFWTFVAETNNVLPLPEETRPFIKGAHGTLIVDAPQDTVYWGLEKVGWVAFRQRLSQSAVVKGDPVFASGNLHGADILPRRGRLPLVAVADNVKGAVYLSDTTFQHADRLPIPAGGPYADGKGYAPTDVAFTKPGEIYVTDGYGKAYFMPAGTDPLKYLGPFYGGKDFSQTPHGITLDPSDDSLLVSARPEGQIKRWSLAGHRVVDIAGLPAGSTVCDVDLWGHYALAPCLDGPSQSPGPVYIVNLKKRAIVATLRPKEDLGFTEAQHIHDAAWYLMPNGRKKELFVLFTNWNPGGIGAMRLVNLAD